MYSCSAARAQSGAVKGKHLSDPPPGTYARNGLAGEGPKHRPLCTLNPSMPQRQYKQEIDVEIRTFKEMTTIYQLPGIDDVNVKRVLPVTGMVFTRSAGTGGPAGEKARSMEPPRGSVLGAWFPI